MPIPFGFRAPSQNAFTIAQLNQDHTPFRTLFRMPLNEDYVRHGVPKCRRLPPFAASSFKIVDALRLTSLFLGVLSFPDEFPTTSLEAHSNLTWVTAHEDTEDVVQAEDITKKLGGLSVGDWSGRILWVRIHGKQPASLRSVFDKIFDTMVTTKEDVRPSDETLRKKISRDFEKELDRCEFTGDSLACQYMHVIPFELGSSVVYILLKAVESRANLIWDTFEESLRTLYDTSSPTIGNVVLLNQRKWQHLITQDPTDTINIAANIIIGSVTIHYVSDQLSGLLLSTQPRLWLLQEAITQTYTAFTREVVDPRLPSAATPRIKSDAEVAAFLLWSLSDAATLYLRFATKDLKAEAEGLVRDFRAKLTERKELLKKRKREADEGDGGQRKKQKKSKNEAPAAMNSITTLPAPMKKVGTSVYPSLEKWCSLLTYPHELEYIEGDEPVLPKLFLETLGIEEDEPELTADSKQVLENVGIQPESRGIERFGVIHEKATAFLLMLANWSAYA
ncbi:hypothetical protein GGX14DRAFT_460471 [Mycena pura]|uniref:Uncharacterized protein n=1 Tax=Mycena pura TaxID=153505 RepID=A0AAD6YDR8_9AGAR|nr:hypothetical protein GGX14DRAFT_460471 [Mycena pura]